MAIELTDELIKIQMLSDEAHAEARRIAAEHGTTSQGLSDEQRAAWDAALSTWRERADEAQSAITAHAAAIGEPRNKVEAAVKKAVRHPEPEPVEA
ncbi:hypothetical protein [Streptomyces sp. NPDC086023]|uniref:hypothetical protein n=1 Tax=Streptomyces sp. NPDC086023 TaxID=3365746 RepID=UPI0037D4D5A0